MVDCDTASFVDALVTDDGPYPTEKEAITAGCYGAADWCIENNVRYRRQLQRALRMNPYTLIGVFLDHPRAVAETFVQHVWAERPQLVACEKDEDRPWSIVAVLDGHVTPAYVERLV